MASYVYLIIHRASGKLYVGKGNDPFIRWRKHQSLAQNGDRRPLYCALRKYGVDAFDFAPKFEELPDASDAYDAEKFWIAYFKSIGANLYNLTDGGDGCLNPSLETRMKMREAKVGKPRSPEAVAATASAIRGKPRSIETRLKLSLLKLGKPGRKQSSEERELRTVKLKLICSTPEARERLKRTAKLYQARRRFFKAHTGWFDSVTTLGSE